MSLLEKIKSSLLQEECSNLWIAASAEPPRNDKDAVIASEAWQSFVPAIRMNDNYLISHIDSG